MSKPNPRSLEVVRTTRVSPHLLRVTLSGPGMQDFPEGRESANCKLVINDESGRDVTRTYTIRSYRADVQEVDIDFFIHAAEGPASTWAVNASPGSKIILKGPSSPKLVSENTDWVLLAGDMSAMPAIEANLERLAPSTSGVAVLEVVNESDVRRIAKPEGVALHWVINPSPETPNDILVNAIKALELPAGEGAVWLAGESSAIKVLRRHFKEEVGIARPNLYASGYWQIGLTEDSHQQVKRLEAAS